MSNFCMSYANLSPGLRNSYSDATHKTVEGTFRKYFSNWRGFFAKYEGYDLDFVVTTHKDIEKLKVFGPTIVRKMKIIEFMIHLPVKINDLNHYLDLVFSGIAQTVSKYQVPEEEIEKIKEECKRELDIV